jgi:beta-glucanase (GH16 family)
MWRYNRILLVALVSALVGAGVAALLFFTLRPAPTERVEAPPPSALSTTPAQTPTGPANFVDRFGVIDFDRWQVSHGWHNGSWVENDWRRENVSAGSEGLAITLARAIEPDEKPFSSGEVQSTQHFRYGYFETRMRVPRADGVVAGFFTFVRPQGRESWQEIDIEIVGNNTRVLELAYHVGGRSRKKIVNLGFDAADGFNTYAFDWQPEVINFYVNNQLVWEARGERVERLNNEQQLIFNLWNTEELHRWTGRIRGEGPWRMDVACVAQADAYRGASLCAQEAAASPG